MRYAKIIDCSVCDGPGFRVSLFTQGCPHHCPGCFNPETWPFEGGKEWSDEAFYTLITALQKPFCSGLTLLGGEPLAPSNIKALIEVMKEVKKVCPEKDVWCWTGYHFEDLSTDQMELLKYVDVVISEPFILERKVRDLKYAGSDNQRMWKRKGDVWEECPIE